MRSLKERKIYNGNKLVYGKWYRIHNNEYCSGYMLFKFSHISDSFFVHDIKCYHYNYRTYNTNTVIPCFDFNGVNYCVRVGDEEVLKYFDSI